MLFRSIIVSCSGKQESFTNQIDFENIKRDSVYHLLKDTANPGVVINIELEYPVLYADTSVLNSIQKKISASLINRMGG